MSVFFTDFVSYLFWTFSNLFFFYEMGPLLLVSGRVFYVTFHTFGWGTKGGIGYLLATSTRISSFSPKLNANLRTMRGYIHGKLGSQLFNLILLNFLLSVWLLLFILFFESYFFIGFDLVLLLHYGTFMVLLGHSLLAQSHLWRHESSCNPMKPDLRVAVSSVTTCRMLARG